MRGLLSDSRVKKMIIYKMLILLLAIVLSMTLLRGILVNHSTYKGVTKYLDDKMATASMLAVGTTSASLVVSLLPDDTGSAIANELAEFTSYLLLVVSAIFLERYLLTSLGFVASTIILPLSFLFIGISIFTNAENKTKFKEYAYRLLIFGLCIVLIIPLGCMCGRAIEEANSASIQKALNAAKEADEMVESLPEDEKEKNIFDTVGGFFSGLWKSATEGYEWAKTTLSNFMASVAVMLVTTLAIPILIVFCFIWLIKFLTKRDFVIAVVKYANTFVESTKKSLQRKKNNITIQA